MRAFLSKVFNTARNIGHRVNRTFNTIKSHTRTAIPYVRRIAKDIAEGAKNYSTLPVVGSVVSQVGAAADILHRGTRVAEHGLHAAEQFQRSMGLET